MPAGSLIGKAPIFSGMPVALGWYVCSRPLPFRTSKASGAEAQNRSVWLLPFVSSTNFTPALVLRFCTSSLAPG
jgi:hypothetical protein